MFSIEQWSSRETVIEVPLPATGQVFYLAITGEDKEEKVDAALPYIYRAVIDSHVEIKGALDLADAFWAVPMAEVIADTIRDEMIMRGLQVEGATK